MKFLKQKLRKITITAEVKIAELEDTVIELSKMKCRKRRKKKKTEKMIRVSVTCGKLSKIYTWAIESHEREKKEHKIIIITIIIIIEIRIASTHTAPLCARPRSKFLTCINT